MQNKKPLTGFFVQSLPTAEIPTGRTALAVTVPAEELVEAGRIRLEREFRDRTVALRALPVSLEHLPLEACASVAFECHGFFIAL